MDLEAEALEKIYVRFGLEIRPCDSGLAHRALVALMIDYLRLERGMDVGVWPKNFASKVRVPKQPNDLRHDPRQMSFYGDGHTEELTNRKKR